MDDASSWPNDEATPEPQAAVMPDQLCGHCDRGWLYRGAATAGWRRAPTRDTPETQAWVTQGGAVYQAPRGEFLALAELCNCVRRHPANRFPERRFQELDYAECIRA